MEGQYLEIKQYKQIDIQLLIDKMNFYLDEYNNLSSKKKFLF